MKILFLILICLFLNVDQFAQENIVEPNQKKIGDAVYYQEFLNAASDKDGLSRIDVFIQVPYKNVQFLKSNKGFTAKYSITASVFDSAKNQLIVEKTWSETIDVFDFTLTTSKDNYKLSRKTFDLMPGTYTIRTMLQDKDSKQEAVGESIVKVRSYDNVISLSDILLITKYDSTKSKNEIIPNISRNVPTSKDRITFYFEVYFKDSVDTERTFEISVFNSDNENIHKEVYNRNLKPGTNKILYSLAQFPFELGVYSLRVSVLDENSKVIETVAKGFYSHWKGLPAVITDIEKAISQTVYIATPDELEYMEDGENVKEKTKRFLEYWKKKDPSPNNDENEIFDEYFRRISFSNENFSNYIEGWRSDRGMVYTILGAPNNVDRHPFEYDSKPYEVWEYYDLNRSFVFLDQTGFGDYRLITPLTGDLYRYRY
ncbi:MAG: GWxTD domain-containing protein [Ignavibacterium sp.]|jgi:GWxTD domain-containing protein|nr:GWxTD domain-containing protein [Ignavibacterium sp.]